jgi:TonB family protein
MLRVFGIDDEAPESGGRIRSDGEMTTLLRGRGDIFAVETDARLHRLETSCVILGIVAGMWLTMLEFFEPHPDFIADIPDRRGAVLHHAVARPDHPPFRVPDTGSDRKTLSPSKNRGPGTQAHGGGGDPRARATGKGVLGILSGRIKGRAVASADITAKGGFVKDIDAIVSGLGGLKTGGEGRSGRQIESALGFGTGYGSGIGGGSGGVADLLDGLLSSADIESLPLKNPAKLRVRPPKLINGGAISHGRSRADIMRAVNQYLVALRHVYNQRLRKKPGLRGKITVKFAIDEFGRVIFASVVESTIADETLERGVIAKIKRWRFERIDRPGDVTEVIYPFVFSQ